MDSASKILNEAKGLFMQYGIKSVTMDDIAKHMGMSKKTIYQYVSNKEDLISRILQSHVNEEKAIVLEIRECASDAVEELVLIARFVIQQLRQLSPRTMHDLQKYYFKAFSIWDKFHGEIIYDIIKTNIKWGQEDGLYRADVNPKIIAKIYVATTKMIADDLLFPLHEYSFDVLYRQFIKYHIEGIISEKGSSLFKHYLNQMNQDEVL